MNDRIYNIALDLYMTENTFRIKKLAGDGFKPHWYYNDEDREIILYKLSATSALKIWNQISERVQASEDCSGFVTSIDPFCIAYNNNCYRCHRYAICTKRNCDILDVLDKECLHIECVLSKAWYEHNVRTINALLKNLTQNKEA